MKRWSILSLLAVLVLALLVHAPPASAQPQEASGSFAIVAQTPVETRLADGNIILSADETIAVSGDFEGTLMITTVYNFHPNGTFTSQSEGAFNGTLFNGPEGTLTYKSAGWGEWTTVGGNPTPLTFEGRNVGRGIGGGLSNLHFNGSFDAPNYTGDVHFAP
ncbi:MAG: hypothetical protein R3300_02925 [Candidatus Promineifilaceae bacterium]|nr:hypothetical protein [Candidatus Promineifilaceae bacterium]